MKFKEWAESADPEELNKIASAMQNALTENLNAAVEERILKLAEEGVIEIVGKRDDQQVTDSVNRPDLELMKAAIGEAVAAGDVSKIQQLVGAVNEQFGEKVAKIAISQTQQQTKDALVAGTIPKEVGEPLLQICEEYLKNAE